MTPYQESIAVEVWDQVKPMTWEQICERIAIELCIATMKMDEKYDDDLSNLS